MIPNILCFIAGLVFGMMGGVFTAALLAAAHDEEDDI